MILPENKHFSNIVLIGMAGAGKSTVGSLLAKGLGFGFVDTDELIAVSRGSTLQEVLDTLGRKRFQAVEEKVLCGVSLDEHVIATGGSAIYSASGMAHLEAIGTVVWLDVPLEELVRRVNNLNSRGLVNPEGESFAELYHKRLPLYRRYGKIHCPCSGKTPQEIVDMLIARLQHQ